jgi:ubiquinone/menaquinone biosynthesis C-methylase UbiE
MNQISKINQLFSVDVEVFQNKIHYRTNDLVNQKNQDQTKNVFSDKWSEVAKYKQVEKLYEFQFEWFLSLYGFDSENSLKDFLSTKKIILDTGCGLGYKAAWFAKLAPHAIVIGIDISDAIDIAAEKFKSLENLYFIKGDIADTKLHDNVIDFTVCDQVIMHTESPEKTFSHLSSKTSNNGEFACYVYSKKALPRELVDDYFRSATHEITNEDMWKFSKQLTELGKRLSELNVTFESPDLPLLGIKGGTYDIQRFIYWNFLKCFWKEEWGFDLSMSTNYDWYSPSNAKRFSKSEFLDLVNTNQLKVVSFHEEEACYSGRFSAKFD